MADRIRTAVLERSAPPVILNGDTDLLSPEKVLTAGARILDPTYAAAYIFQYETWQDELWDYLDTIGEFGFAHWWLAQAISRVRLIAAERVPGYAEPKPLETGPAADLMARISTTEIMEGFGLHIPLVGKCFLVGQTNPLFGEEWSVKSADEVKPTGKKTFDQMLTLMRRAGRSRSQAATRDTFEVQVAEGKWSPLENALVSEIKHDHPRYGWKSISASKSAIPILREISLYDRHIIATLVSRLAMNGIILFPSEMTFPVKEQFKQAADPFIAEFIDHASKSIKNPGSASAALPFPLRVSSQFIDKIKHLPFASQLDPRIIAARKEAISRLATTINVSRERILGMGSVNHWGQWEIKDDEVNMHIVPPVELVVAGLTKTYLRPLLLADNQPLLSPDGNPIISWYDTGELTQQPDLSQNARAAYDDANLSREAYVRYLGFEPSDMPDDAELAKIILLKQALGAQFNPAHLEHLTGVTIATTPDAATPEPELDPDAPPPADAGDARQPERNTGRRAR